MENFVSPFAQPLIDPETQETFGTGWLPPLPDLTDKTEADVDIPEMAQKMRLSTSQSLPTTVNLRQWCSPIEDQGNLGSCTANAAVGVVEYFEKRAFNKYIDGSRLFVYKVTRNLMGVTGDTGAFLRTAMAALTFGGVPPAQYWPYTDKKPDFDKEPSAFVYAVADNFEAIRYFCHDPLGKNLPTDQVLANVKKWLAAGVPSMFGFYVFPSLYSGSDVPGGIPYPCRGEKAIGGHAIVAVGYDDNKKIVNKNCKQETTGALLIRNSWGKRWGDQGYGWLPYQYVLDKLATDFWSLLQMEWVDTKNFGLD